MQKRSRPPNILYAWGLNQHGQLGLGIENSVISLPQEVPLKTLDISADDIKSVCVGIGNTFLLLKNGRVYGAGINNIGQLGQNNLINRSFVLLDVLREFCIRDISLKWESVYALTEDKTCIGWGSNSHGQLSRDPLTMKSTFLPVSIMENVKSVAVGLNFIVILTLSGEVFSCGDGRYGQLGRPSPFHKWGIAQIETYETVRAIACGQNHAMYITESNAVFVWGSNSSAQIPYELEKTVVTLPTEVQVTPSTPDTHSKIVCGWKHSGILLGSGQLWSWGDSSMGQLGGAGIPDPQPKIMLDERTKIKKALFGYGHVFLLLDHGVTLCWGDNVHGTCGIGSHKDIIYPVQYRCGINSKVLRIFTGYRQCFALAL